MKWSIMPGILALTLSVGCKDTTDTNPNADPEAGSGTDTGPDEDPDNADSTGDTADTGEDEGLPTTPPTSVELLSNDGLRLAGAVASNPEGTRFYVAAHDDDDRPGVFVVSAADGSKTPLHVGAPLLYPSDLSISCDGERLFVSDMGLGASTDMTGDLEGDLEAAPETRGGIHVISTANGSISRLETTGLLRAAGLIVSVDCSTLYVTGWAEDEQPAVFTVPLAGGVASELYKGAPLTSPTGVHVDASEVAWVMDHLARGTSGEGTLFAIDNSGNISEVASGLGMGRHGGVSLTPGGVTAVIPVKDDFNGSYLITANTETGDVATISTPDILQPTGVAAARQAPVMVVAGEDSIHIATFEQ